MLKSIRNKLIGSSGNQLSRPMLAVALALAASAVMVQWRTRRTEKANPPQGRFVEVDGVRLHYVERGEGQPLVLLHGNGTMIQDFDVSGLIDLASRRYRVVVFDRPGYGYSDRPRATVWTPVAQARLIEGALRKLGVERPIVLGHSWGTQVALSLALEFPSYVQSLVLLSGYYFPTLRLDVPVLSGPAIPVLGDVIRHTISPWLGRLMWPGLLRILFGPGPVPARFNAFPVWMVLRPSQIRASAAESALLVPSAVALSRRYHELKMPVFIMAGDRDRFVNAKRHSARLHQEIPQSELTLTPGAGHMIHQLVPEQVMSAIDQARDAITAQSGTEGSRGPSFAETLQAV